uniref:Uncharacterized protein n=1 Tax=Romanomermis culicivorax TaxID=13658 RepID=A0A915I2C2_ROMCU
MYRHPESKPSIFKKVQEKRPCENEETKCHCPWARKIKKSEKNGENSAPNENSNFWRVDYSIPNTQSLSN